MINNFQSNESAINSLIESDNDEDWNVNIKKSESHSQRKSSDPQQVGFKLAEEIRRLKLELANERKEKRMLLVTNENLQEQLKNAEERMKELEAKEFKSARKLSSVVGELQRETINRRSSEEELHKLKNDRKQSKKDHEKSLQQILNTQQKLDEMQKQLIYWKECVGAYESKIKEFVSDKGIREQVLEEQRQRVVSLENSLFKAKSKYLRFKQACLDLLSPSNSRQQAQDKTLNLEVNLSVDDELDFDFLMKIIRKKNQVYLESRKNYKNYIHKLIGVVKMYEEMLPSEQFLDDSLL